MESAILWVGIDVGRYFHAIRVVDSAGEVVWERKQVVNTTFTLRRVLEKLHRFSHGRQLVFATEQAGGNASALVRLLTQAQEIVYLTQPLRVHRFHLALGQPHKSDAYDAQVIAEFARQNHARLPRVRPGTPEVQALRVLSRRLETVTRDLTRSLNRLRATLAEYAPEWLVCRVFSDWSSQAALGTLERYGRISKLQRTPVSRLAKSLSNWTRGRFGEDQAHALKESFAEVSLCAELEQAYVQAITSLARQIRALLAEKERLLELVAAQGESMPAMAALQAEQGYGPQTAAVIVSEVSEMDEFPTEPKFATYCGVTPLNRKSGISQGSSRLSRFTNKRLLGAIFQSTLVMVSKDPRSQQYYRQKLAGRSDPKTKTRALLALARHRTRKLYKILREASWTSLPAPDLAA